MKLFLLNIYILAVIFLTPPKKTTTNKQKQNGIMEAQLQKNEVQEGKL